MLLSVRTWLKVWDTPIEEVLIRPHPTFALKAAMLYPEGDGLPNAYMEPISRKKN
jgi:hypothetical protein